MFKKYISNSVIILIALFLASCATTNNVRPKLPREISFYTRNLNFPVSMTEGFYDENYNLLESSDYEVVYSFEKVIPIIDEETGDFLIPEQTNILLDNYLKKIMKQYKGNAVVNFRVEKLSRDDKISDITKIVTNSWYDEVKDRHKDDPIIDLKLIKSNEQGEIELSEIDSQNATLKKFKDYGSAVIVISGDVVKIKKEEK
jgi:hypothetical protein